MLRYDPRADAPGCRDTSFDLLKKALDLGVEVVGGIPHFEETMQSGTESVRLLCEEAARRGLRVDMHRDETDDPMSRHIETLAAETHRLDLSGRVNGSHLTSMHSMDNYYVSKLIPLIARAGVSAVANPLINITIQGRHDTYPKRRGMTRVPELLAAGVPVGFGPDCVMDPWYSLGSGDMLEVAQMGLHVNQMTGSGSDATVLRIRHVGAGPYPRAGRLRARRRLPCRPGGVAGCHPIEAIRLRATRLVVIRRGRGVARTPPRVARLELPGRPVFTDWTRGL